MYLTKWYRLPRRCREQLEVVGGPIFETKTTQLKLSKAKLPGIANIAYRCGNSRAILGSYGITCHSTEVTIPPLPQPIKQIFDLATPEGCKAELI